MFLCFHSYVTNYMIAFSDSLPASDTLVISLNEKRIHNHLKSYKERFVNLFMIPFQFLNLEIFES
jgi:hypothetical protein